MLKIFKIKHFHHFLRETVVSFSCTTAIDSFSLIKYRWIVQSFVYLTTKDCLWFQHFIQENIQMIQEHSHYEHETSQVNNLIYTDCSSIPKLHTTGLLFHPQTAHHRIALPSPNCTPQDPKSKSQNGVNDSMQIFPYLHHFRVVELWNTFQVLEVVVLIIKIDAILLLLCKLSFPILHT